MTFGAFTREALTVVIVAAIVHALIGETLDDFVWMLAGGATGAWISSRYTPADLINRIRRRPPK